MIEPNPWSAPDGTEVLIAVLEQLGHVSDERRTDDPLPSWVVRRIGGPDDGRLVDHGVYSVHSFAGTNAGAQSAALDAHRLIIALASRGQQAVTISTGVVYVDGVTVTEGPRYAQYVADKTIERYVGTYQVDLRYVAA